MLQLENESFLESVVNFTSLFPKVLDQTEYL